MPLINHRATSIVYVASGRRSMAASNQDAQGSFLANLAPVGSAGFERTLLFAWPPLHPSIQLAEGAVAQSAWLASAPGAPQVRLPVDIPQR